MCVEYRSSHGLVPQTVAPQGVNESMRDLVDVPPENPKLKDVAVKEVHEEGINYSSRLRCVPSIRVDTLRSAKQWRCRSSWHLGCEDRVLQSGGAHVVAKRVEVVLI